MKYNFDEIVDRTDTNSVMYDLRKLFFGTNDVLPMWVADMNFKTPDFVVDAIRKRAEHEIFSYTIRPPSFNNSIVKWLKGRHNWEIKNEWLSFSPGVVAGITNAIMAFSNPGDKIIVQPPVYFPFFESITGSDRLCVENPLKLVEGRYHFDFEQLISVIDKKTKILILCSPHNPGGMVWRKEELLELGRICKKNNILVISDEIHADLTFNGYFHTPFQIISEELGMNSIVVMSASKTFNLAGLSSSFLIIPDSKLLEQYEKLLKTMHLTSGNIFGSIALEAAFTHGDEWLDQLMIYLEKNYNYLQNFISEKLPRIKVMKPEATFLVWLDFRGYGMSSKELNKFLIEEAKLGLFNGEMFGTGGEGFVRINIGTPLSVLEEAMKRLVEAHKLIS
ncbi:MalY/PatB family protein [Bacteroidota bacterium]